MEYDEKVIRLMNADKTGVTGNIEDGYCIKEELYEFQQELLLDDKMSVLLPERFVDMPHDFAILKYPSEQRPAAIKMSEDGSINFGFNLLEVPAEKESIEEFRDMFYNACKNAFPMNVFFKKELEEVDNTNMGWFSYRSYTTDGPIFNMMMCRPLCKKTLHVIFNCPFSEKENWEEVALAVMRSIKDLEQG